MRQTSSYRDGGSRGSTVDTYGVARLRSGKSGANDLLSLRTIARVVRRNDGLPIRQIINGRRNRPVGEYASFKSQMRQPWESSHERFAQCLDEVDPEISQTLAQPHKLFFRLNGKATIYTPDTELWTERGHFVREIKEEAELREKPELKRKFDEIERIYALAGINFQILTDRQIRIEPRLENVMTVQKHLRHKMPWECEQRLIDFLRDRDGATSFSECAKALRAGDQGADFLMTAMCRRLVRLDLSKPLSGRTAVLRHHANDPNQSTLAIRRNVKPPEYKK